MCTCPPGNVCIIACRTPSGAPREVQRKLWDVEKARGLSSGLSSKRLPARPPRFELLKEYILDESMPMPHSFFCLATATEQVCRNLLERNLQPQRASL